MRTQSTDTDPSVERIQIEGLRRLTPTQRFQIANRLTRSAFTLSWANFRRKHADLDENEAALLWVRVLYGDDLADRVSAYVKDLEDQERRE
jgi:hypothetical protein